MYISGRIFFLIFFFVFNYFILFIYFWLHWVFAAARGLSLVAARGGYSSLQCAGFSLRWLLLWSTGSRRMGFSSCGSRALVHRLSSCGARIQLLHGMWDLPGPGLKPMSPALAGGFLTTAPPGKPHLRKNFCEPRFLHLPIHKKRENHSLEISVLCDQRCMPLPRCMLDCTCSPAKNYTQTAFSPASSEQFLQRY